MDVIDLQSKARPRLGRIEHYWFENALTHLKRTLFHRIVIPFEPFDSGLEYVEQPETTELVVEWVNMGLADPSDLDGVVIKMGITRDVEASICLGSAHNPVDLKELSLTRDQPDVYRVECRAMVDFEHEGVARNESFEFRALVKYVGETD